MRNKILQAVGVLSLGFLLLNWTSAKTNQSPPYLWAAISISDPLFHEGWTKDLAVHFTVVNDGTETIDPKLTQSKLIINGKELEDTGFILGNGPKDAKWTALRPGDSLMFAYTLEEYFKEPGVYKVSWKGDGFEAPPIVFRVMPRKNKVQ